MVVNRPTAGARLRAILRDLPAITAIDLSGDIDGFAEKALDVAYRQATKREPATILLNFADVGYVNSKGIALLISLLMRARKSGHLLLATGLSDHYAGIFEITRLSDFICVVPDEAAALALGREPT